MKNTQMASRTDAEAAIPEDRRQETRESAELAVTVTSLPVREVSFGGHLVDISRSGIGLRLGCQIDNGATLAVEWGETIVIGEIVHCCKISTYYRAGLRISYIILDRSGSKPRTTVFLQ